MPFRKHFLRKNSRKVLRKNSRKEAQRRPRTSFIWNVTDNIDCDSYINMKRMTMGRKTYNDNYRQEWAGRRLQ